MCIAVTNRNMMVQFVDDDAEKTLASASTMGVEGERVSVDTASQLGRRAAENAIEKGIRHVVIDRGGFRFHGRIKALVEAACETGLTTSSKEAK